jgi:hypothetical protein
MLHFCSPIRGQLADLDLLLLGNPIGDTFICCSICPEIYPPIEPLGSHEQLGNITSMASYAEERYFENG